MQKLSDTSLAIDYQNNIGSRYKHDNYDNSHLENNLQNKVDILSKYVEVRNEAIKLRQAGDRWLELEHVKGKFRRHQNSPYYNELKPVLEERERLASVIVDNYHDYKNLITRSKLNYNTIEKHAGRQEHQYYFKRIDYNGSIKDIKGFGRILDIQEQVRKWNEGELFAAVLKQSGKELREITLKIIEGIEEHKAH